MARLADSIDAIILRTTRFSESDLIAQVLTLSTGRRGVIAKGARKPKSRLGARLDPFLIVTLQIVEGRGELAIVRGVEVVQTFEHIRTSWSAQKIAAQALELVTRISVEHEANAPLYHLTANFLATLDHTTNTQTDALDDDTLITAFGLKLLHITGLAPQLASCVRCESTNQIAAFSADDGGVLCANCRTVHDQRLTPGAYAAAVSLMQSPLRNLATDSSVRTLKSAVISDVNQRIVAATCEAHAGFRPRA